MEGIDRQGVHSGDIRDFEHDHLEHGEHHNERHHAGHEAHHEHHHEEPMSTDEAVRSLLLLGQVALEANDFESAVEAYASVLKLEQNEVALYNLGSFYARGAGVRRNYMEAARLFHQAELMGNARAGMLCRKCMFDFIHTNIENKTPTDLYAAMGVFVAHVYPEATDAQAEVVNGLLAIANTCQSKGEHVEAQKALRAATEFGGE